MIFLLEALSRSKYKSKFNLDFFFFEKIKFNFLGFHVVVGTREDLSILIITVELILTKLGWFQHFSTSQNSISTFFEKKFDFWGFPCSKDLSIDVSITTVRWYCWRSGDFLSRGSDRQTGFWNPHNYGDMSAHKKFRLKIRS